MFPLLLRQNNNDDDDKPFHFDIVVPSLPGFGWSSGARRSGFGPVQIATVLRNLMLRLGYARFMIQGGDWGSLLGSDIATMFPQNVIAYHTNFAVIRTPMSLIKSLVASCCPRVFLSSADQIDLMFPLTEKFAFILQETGYFHLQATKPDTIGIALASSPVALAVYLWEKFDAAWPHNDRDAVLDAIMVYWLTSSITTTCRLYAEGVRSVEHSKWQRVPCVRVPVGVARFKADIGHAMDWQLRDKYPDLVHSTWHSLGGHFAAMEVPSVLYADFMEFTMKVWSLKGKNIIN